MLTRKELRKNKIVAVQWHTAMDSQVCPLCAKLQGRVFPIRSRELKRFNPPIHEGCRCILSYITDRERGIKERLREYKPISRRLLKKWMRERKS